MYSGVGQAVVADDKTPGTAPDLIKIWVEMKAKLRDRLGIYKLPTGVPVILPTPTGPKLFPKLTFSNATALMTGWGRFADVLSAAVIKEGRDPSKATAALRFLNRQKLDWAETVMDQTNNLSSKVEGRFLFPTHVKLLFEMLDQYVLELNLGVWSAFNIETSMERMEQALSTTTGGTLLLAPIKAGAAVADALEKGFPPWLAKFADITEIIKWGSIGGGLFLLYWYVLRPQKKS